MQSKCMVNIPMGNKEKNTSLKFLTLTPRPHLSTVLGVSDL